MVITQANLPFSCAWMNIIQVQWKTKKFNLPIPHNSFPLLASRSIFLWDDVAIYVPQIEMTDSFAAQSDKVYLYQFEYDGIGNAYFAGTGLPQPAKEAYPGHSYELVS